MTRTQQAASERSRPAERRESIAADSRGSAAHWVLFAAGLILFVAGLGVVVGMPGSPLTDVGPDTTTPDATQPTDRPATPATTAPTTRPPTTPAATPAPTTDRQPTRRPETTSQAPTTTSRAPTTTARRTTTGRSASARILAFYPSRGSYETGETVFSRVVVQNTGQRKHTYFVGYSVIGPDGREYHNGGTTGTKVTLDPGERASVPLEWRVERGVPAGPYDTLTIVWAESDRSKLETELDEGLVKDVFEVERD